MTNRTETSGFQDPTLHWRDASVEVHKVVVGPFDNNVFVVRCRQTGDAVLIDAANEHEQLLTLCKRLGVKRVLETHGHWDHIQAIPALREAGYEVAVTAADAPRLKDVGYDVFIDDAEIIEVGDCVCMRYIILDTQRDLFRFRLLIPRCCLRVTLCFRVDLATQNLMVEIFKQSLVRLIINCSRFLLRQLSYLGMDLTQPLARNDLN